VAMVFRGLELSSGGQRENRHDRLVAQISQKGLDPEGLMWFSEPFRFGVPPHGGFSMGIERLTATLLGIENVKEAALFPRDPERLQP
jgi:aspartyl/asparaginyl-tRNA synthetase